MRTVANILKRKGSAVATVRPNFKVIDALRMMVEQNIGSVVVAEDGVFKGIVTERDLSRKVMLHSKSTEETTAGDIMGTEFPNVAPEDSVEYCMAIMSDKNIRYLPVMKDGSLAGIVSINDLVKETILEQKETIAHLKDYLHS